jgi:hypothetical protein
VSRSFVTLIIGMVGKTAVMPELSAEKIAHQANYGRTGHFYVETSGYCPI